MHFRLSLLFLGTSLFLGACAPSLPSPFGKPIHCLSKLPSHLNWLEFSAENENERFACMGYYQAKFRSWQMDFLRRKFRGTTAEELGSSGIRPDFQMRLLGIAEHADKLAKEISPVTRTRLEAFAYGVSKGFETFAHDSYEFRRLGTHPQPWTIADTIGILLLQSFDQTRKGLSQDLKEQALDPKWFPLMDQPLPFDTSILKHGEYTRSHVLQRQADLATDSNPAGSNNWVLSAKRSASGETLLANDPHLGLVHPSFWLPFYFRSKQLGNLFGATLPGTPVIASGLNSSVSWGLTNSYFDVMDAVAVQKKNFVFSSHRPLIWFRFGFLKIPFFFKTFERLPTGEPIIPMETGNPQTAYVIRWSGFDTHGNDIDSLIGIENSNSVAQFEERLSGVGLPSWNFVSADHGKQIGFRTNGKLPRRPTAPTLGVEEAKSEKELKWFYLSSEESPHAYSPQRGYLVTANNAQWPTDAKFSDGRAHALSTRAFRIEELIQEKKKWKLEELKKIQCDRQAIDARFALDAMLDRLEAEKTEWNEDEKSVKLALEKWNFETNSECTACAVFRTWFENLLPQTAKETSLLLKSLLFSPKTIQVKSGFEDAVKTVTRLTQSPLPKWNTFHFAKFPHFSGESQIHPEGLLPTEGDNHTVNVGSSDWNNHYWEQSYGASLRLLVEMSSPPRVLFKLAGSVTDFDRPKLDQPNSPWMLWSQCQYEEVPWLGNEAVTWSEEEWI